jgi:hypothetical protein
MVDPDNSNAEAPVTLMLSVLSDIVTEALLSVAALFTVKVELPFITTLPSVIELEEFNSKVVEVRDKFPPV